MKDPKNMTQTEKYNYIFENQNGYYVANRCGWFESFLSEIRTLIEGGQRLKNAPSAELVGNFGAGNVSIAILVCIGLKLASTLYSGTTKAKDGSYHADEM